MFNKKQLLILIFPIIFFCSNVYSQTTKTVIVLNFEYESHSVSLKGRELTSWIPAQIQKVLVNSPYITIVERNKLNEILKEQALSQTGIIDESTAIKVGKLVGAQKIIMGEYQRSSNKRYSISSRLVDIESGEVQVQRLVSDIKEKEIENYTNDVAVRIIKNIKSEIGLENITKLQNPEAIFNINVSVEKDTFLLGEMLTFTVTTEKDCYLYLFDIGTSGKIHLLFPNKMQPKNFVKSGKNIQIKNIRVGPPTGTEIVKAIATLDSVSYSHLVKSAGSQVSFQPLGDDTDQFSRDLQVMVSPLDHDRWATDIVRLIILE